MKKLTVAIVGYGNLGKALEEVLLNDNRYHLTHIFSRRNITAKVPVAPLSTLQEYKGKFDLLFLCGGSKTDIENHALTYCKDFNTIDSFDNHNHIEIYTKNLDKRCKQYKHTSICCCGWDPGIFSLMRLLFDSIEGNSYTFWGKGVSQGHSQAVRKIADVKDCIQYTLPNKTIVKNIKKGIAPCHNTKSYHTRLCYVVAAKNKTCIKNDIITMPDYFEGYKTKVKFVSPKTLQKHKKMYHAGTVMTLGNTLNFSLQTPSNPTLTAKIMSSFGIALYNLYMSKQYGTFSVLDIAPKYLSICNYKNFL